MGQNIWFTSDLHFGHNRDFLYSPRGFNDIETHDSAIIENINEIVKEDDTLYILGDLMLNDNEYGMDCLNEINCKDIYIILGNHDTSVRAELYAYLPNVKILGCAAPFKYKKWNFMLSHYPMNTANLDDDRAPYLKVWNLCGHSHTKEKIDPITNSIHCELDAWNNYPVSIEQIREFIKDK